MWGVGTGWGIAVVRIMAGIIFAVHGYQKFAGGIQGVAAFFGRLGLPEPQVLAPVIATLELVGGIFLIVGLLSRWLGLVFAIQMAVTTLWVQFPRGGLNAGELDRMLFAAGVLLFLAGAGRASVDRAWLEKNR